MPSASPGVIGRRCTVPPSAATTSASQCGGGVPASAGVSVTCGALAGPCSVTGVVRVESEVGEGGGAGAHDRPVHAVLGEGVPAVEADVPALGHAARRRRAQPPPPDVVLPALRDL